MSKKILMLSSSWNNEITFEIIRGVSDRLEKEDAELHIVNIYDVLDPAGFYEKEAELFRLPNPDNYDGVLVYLTTVQAGSIVDRVVSRYAGSNCKVICMDKSVGSLPCIEVDNQDSVFEIVSHLIEEHGCKVFNYISGPQDNPESILRMTGFMSALKAHGIDMDPERIYYGGFMHSDGIDAYEDYKSRNLHLPDAVVCANDYMALGYADAAGADGYSIPNDFKLTGFDNMPDAAYYFPPITTVERDNYRQGYNAMNALLELIAGLHEGRRYFKSASKVVYNASCGCNKEVDYRQDFNTIYRQKVRDENIRGIQRRVRRLLSSFASIEEIPRALNKCREMLGVSDISLCLNYLKNISRATTGRVGYDEEMKCFTTTDETVVHPDDYMLPEAWRAQKLSKIYVISPVHFDNLTFGYCAVPYEADKWLTLDFRTFSESLSTYIDGVYRRAELDIAYTKLKEIYMIDAATGLLNRSGYTSIAENFYQLKGKKVFLIYFDMDNLKVINDTYGHGVGDLAIRGIARSIKSVFGSDSVRVRMGGDEFLAIGEYTSEEDIDKYKKAVEEYLINYAVELNLEVSPCVSMGHAFNDGSDTEKTLETLVNEADDCMYKVKHMHKHGHT